MATINDGTTTYTPDLVLGWDAAPDSRTVEHPIIGESSVFTLRSAGPASGTLSLFFNSLTTAQAVQAAHRAIAVWSLNLAPQAAIALTYVTAPGGRVGLEAANESGTRWVVRVDFRERT
jgi:hypothetical protein